MLVRFFVDDSADMVQRRQFVRVVAAQRIVLEDAESEEILADTIDREHQRRRRDAEGQEADRERESTFISSCSWRTDQRPVTGQARSDPGDRGESNRRSSSRRSHAVDRERLIHFIFERQRVALAVTRGDALWISHGQETEGRRQDEAKDKKSRGKKKGGRRGSKGEPHTDDGASIAKHPRASAHVRAAKGWGGLLCFIAAGASLARGTVTPASRPLRALIAGIIGYLIGWWCSVMVWRQILMAEQRYRGGQTPERWEDERRKREEAAAAAARETARQK